MEFLTRSADWKLCWGFSFILFPITLLLGFGLATFAMFTLTIIHFKRQQSKTNKDSSVADCLGTGKDVTNVLIDGVSPSQHSAQQMLDAEFLTARVFTTSWSLDLGWGGVTLCVLASVLWILLSKIMRYSPLSTLLA